VSFQKVWVVGWVWGGNVPAGADLLLLMRDAALRVVAV
jgi:hypothetical protein